MSDTWTQRSGADYAQGFNNLLPSGPAWPRESETVLQRFIAGLAQIWGDDVEAQAARLLQIESDPRQTVVLLPDWERAWGLPDKCLAEPLTIADRQTALVQRMTMLGGQSRAFFIAAALMIGYTITIREYSPFMAGVSQCGDTSALDDGVHDYWQIGSPDMRFYWTVSLRALRYTWFRASSGQAGIDPMLRIALATDLECLIRRWKPAHTEVVFDYSPVVSLDYSQSFDSQYLAMEIP